MENLERDYSSKLLIQDIFFDEDRIITLLKQKLILIG